MKNVSQLYVVQVKERQAVCAYELEPVRNTCKHAILMASELATATDALEANWLLGALLKTVWDREIVGRKFVKVR